MRAFIVLILTINFSYGYYCNTICIDTIQTQQPIMSFNQMVQQELQRISNELTKANATFDNINLLTGNKLENYAATRALKQEQLNELKQINFLIKQLIKTEENRIKNLKLQNESILNEK